jgi:hypothetical protein
MKVISLLFFLLSFKSYAQKSFPSQLSKMIEDAGNSFQSFRGELIKNETDTVYQSNIEIEGTLRNEISLLKELDVYIGVIVDSVRIRQGEKIADEWKSKLVALLGSHYQLSQLKIVAWNPANYGWKLSSGKIWIDVTVYPLKTNSKYCFVAFSVTHRKNE